MNTDKAIHIIGLNCISDKRQINEKERRQSIRLKRRIIWEQSTIELDYQKNIPCSTWGIWPLRGLSGQYNPDGNTEDISNQECVKNEGASIFFSILRFISDYFKYEVFKIWWKVEALKFFQGLNFFIKVPD